VQNQIIWKWTPVVGGVWSNVELVSQVRKSELGKVMRIVGRYTITKEGLYYGAPLMMEFVVDFACRCSNRPLERDFRRKVWVITGVPI